MNADEAFFYNFAVVDNSWATPAVYIGAVDGYDDLKVVPAALTNITITDVPILDRIDTDISDDGAGGDANERNWSTLRHLAEAGWVEILMTQGQQRVFLTTAGDTKLDALVVIYDAANP
jgi:hypothetical protein